MAVNGNRIRQLRKEAGITQEELGKKLGVIKQTVSNWENNISEPNSEALSKIASIFDVSIGYLYGNNNPDGYLFFFFNDMLRDVFTTRLKKAISNKGITEEEFLEQIPFEKARGEKYLSGECEPSLEDLIEISQLLETSTDYLLGQIPDLSSAEKKMLNSFIKLSSDYQDIIIGKTKEYLKEQESVAAENPLRKTGTENQGK